MKLWVTLSILGLAGVFSLLLSPQLFEAIPKEVMNEFSPKYIPFLVLINPIVLTLIFTLVGVKTYHSGGYELNIIEPLIKFEKPKDASIYALLKNGIFFGIISGLVVLLFQFMMSPMLPNELMNGREPHLITKIIYGGFTEELIARFGVMSLLTWLLIKWRHSKSDVTYWMAIIISALLFALGHLPFASEITNGLSFEITIYILIGNLLPGIIFGLLYWKNGLESAMLAHMVFHLITLI